MPNVLSGNFRDAHNGGAIGGDDDLALGDVANDVLCSVLAMLQGDSDLAARTMLLAVAWLVHDDPTFGKAAPISAMLMQATTEALDAFHNPPPLIVT